MLRIFDELPGEIPPQATFEHKALEGGLDAATVSLVTARYRDKSGRARIFRFVAKRLDGRSVREAAIYELLAARYAANVSPRVFAILHAASDRTVLCVEAIRRASAWPWRGSAAASAVLARLARFHIESKDAGAVIPHWDYEGELHRSAEATLAALDRCRHSPDLIELARNSRPLERIVLARPRLRRQLLSEPAFGRGPIHGDVHPGNAILRRRGTGNEPVLIDWGRARIGSPLEDVSSWLQSLGYWEGDAKRYHDRLLKRYLSAFGLDQRLSSDIRAAYWMAGASNALSGALLHHLSIAQDELQRSSRRVAAAHAAQDWLRVIRRADAWWS